jgi:hypothetical protein
MRAPLATRSKENPPSFAARTPALFFKEGEQAVPSPTPWGMKQNRHALRRFVPFENGGGKARSA